MTVRDSSFQILCYGHALPLPLPLTSSEGGGACTRTLPPTLVSQEAKMDF